MFRAELAGLKVDELRKRARAAGADMARVEEAIDEENKGAIVELVMQAETQYLRAELAGLKVGALRKRAKAVGADMARVEDAIDEEDKAAIVELIVEAGSSAGRADIPEGVAEKPTSTSEPEPEPATREVHSAVGEPASVDVAGAADWTLTPIQPSRISDFLATICIFGSMRFPVPLEARMLFAALQAAGVHLKVVDMKAGQDIDKEVYEWIEHCHAFLAFGTKNYGEDTGNSACTYNEVKFAQAKKKNIILLRMIPWEEEFEELQARVLFNRNMLTLEWQQGQAMPPSLVGEILKAMDLPTTGALGSPTALAHETAVARSAAEAANVSRAQAEAAKAQAQAQLAQAQASAAAAKAQAEAAQVQAQAQEAMAMAAAEEDAARRLQEEVRAAEVVEKQRKEQAQAQAQAEAERAMALAAAERRAAMIVELETAEAARAVQICRQLAELPAKSTDQDVISVTFTEPGPLGLQLTDMIGDGDSLSVCVQEINPGTQAMKHASVNAGLVLCTVQGESVASKSYEGTIEMIKKAGRPVTISFVPGCPIMAHVLRGGPDRAVPLLLEALAETGGLDSILCGLRILAAGSEDRKTAVLSAGGLEAVLQAMGAHGGSAGVQEQGCAALWALEV